jgi:hypothetical protein
MHSFFALCKKDATPIPCSRILLENLTVDEMAKKFHTFYGPETSLTEPVKSTPNLHNLFL